MQKELHILMPCIRPFNIPRIAPSILQAERCCLALRWHILAQGDDPDPKGVLKINSCLAMVPMEAWYFTPSDDTLHHMSLFRRLGEIITANPGAKAVIFSEERGPKENSRILHAAPENMKPGAVDGSQCIFLRSFVGDKRYEWEKHRHEVDGFFAKELFEKEPSAFYFCDEVLVRFNSLEWTC